MSRYYLYTLLGCLILGGCTPKWTKQSSILKPRFSYIIADGVGSTEEAARRAADYCAKRQYLDQTTRPEIPPYCAATLELLLPGQSRSLLLPATNLQTQGTLPCGWGLYGKEHVEQIDASGIQLLTLNPQGSIVELPAEQAPRNLIRVWNVFQYQRPEATISGNCLPATNFVASSSSGKVGWAALNLLLPGLGSARMRRDGTAFNQSHLFMATYLGSLASWLAVRHVRNTNIHAINQSWDVNEQADLMRRIDHYGTIKDSLLGVAAGTLLVSLLDVIIGDVDRVDLWDFSPVNRGMSFSVRSR